jgi:glycosyltransferase involved in cell wall biosynthesis
MRRLRIRTWHIHGSYLYYLCHAHQEFYLPVKPDWPYGYFGRPKSYPSPDNLHEVPAEEVRDLALDSILFQSRRNYLEAQYEILSEEQRRLPCIYLEHDPPREHPTDTRHIVDDAGVPLVHVTAFNDLMWDSGRTPTRVIDHGVVVLEGVRYSGELVRGIAVINNLRKRGRRLGADVFDQLRGEIPLDLVGAGWEEAGGLCGVPHRELPVFEARYRFFFNSIRYTSLGLSVCEAMMVGMPIVGLATTEMVTVVENGISGCLDTSVDRLAERMQGLLRDPGEARRLGEGTRRAALERFSIHRFIRDWDETFAEVAGRPLGEVLRARPNGSARAAAPAVGKLQQVVGAL